MTTSKDKAFVWIFLPQEASPTVAGVVQNVNEKYYFTYGQSYLSNPKAIAIFPEELPLIKGTFSPKHNIASCLRDASPDAWGRRVILHALYNSGMISDKYDELDEITFFLKSGSDRIGALDFQESSEHYIARLQNDIKLKDLLEAVSYIEEGKKLNYDLTLALLHGTSIGGARPKVFINSSNQKFIAKFSSSDDYYDIIRAEYIVMKLAKKCGIDVADVQLESSLNKDVLLVKRFDRKRVGESWTRKLMLSALTLLNLHEMEARYASYEDFALLIRHKFSSPKNTLKELFKRLVFNILVGNTDDHARNHAAFWDGEKYKLTPAYDICPQPRSGSMAGQAMKIIGQDNRSLLINCLSSSKNYLLSEEESIEIIRAMIQTIESEWESICINSGIKKIDKILLETNQIFNPYIFEEISKHTQIIKNPNG
ncbi:MAG: HipA domain-containing protein [Leptospiraceae bacterium]|nr:HipA domain-containing protein [Leptospiraceae bacterium]MCP5499744.1 HipA domain-containing protein [Leptospiraceae bacterium]